MQVRFLFRDFGNEYGIDSCSAGTLRLCDPGRTQQWRQNEDPRKTINFQQPRTKAWPLAVLLKRPVTHTDCAVTDKNKKLRLIPAAAVAAGEFSQA